jgi:hypothetical protein
MDREELVVVMFLSEAQKHHNNKEFLSKFGLFMKLQNGLIERI